jgi:hypothetical protein
MEQHNPKREETMKTKMNHAVRRWFHRAVVASLLLASSQVNAWDGAANATISVIEVTSSTNYGFRVYLTGVTALCTGGPSWAYLLETDSNYKVYVAAALTAKAQGTAVTVYSIRDSSGYCHIGDMQF